MYLKIIISVWLLSILYSCHKGYRIEGYVDNVANGNVAVLQKQQGVSFVNADSVYVRNGRFLFKGRQDTATMALISISGKDRLPFAPLLFILENGRLEARIDTLSTIAGTLRNERFQTYINEKSRFDAGIAQLEQQYAASYTAGVLSDSLYQELQRQFLDYKSRQKNLTLDYILNNADDISGIYLFVQNSFWFTPEEQHRIISRGNERFKDNPAIRTVSRLLSRNPNVAPGMSYIDLKMNAPDGSRVSLSDYIGKGKYVLIDFWSSGCNPCHTQMPQLIELYDRFRNKNFEIIGVSFDVDKNEWTQYIEEMNLTWPQMSDFKGYDSEAIMQYAIQGIPHTVLVNPQGTIVAKDLRGDELNNILKRLLK